MASESVIGSEHFEHFTCMWHLISGVEPCPSRVIPTRREEPDTIGRDALRQVGAQWREATSKVSQPLYVQTTDLRNHSRFPEVCLNLFRATVRKPADSSAKRDRSWAAHERLAMTNEGGL